MEIYLDTADLNAVKRLNKILPIKGVTTNPSIVAKEKKKVKEVIQNLRDILGEDATLFAQTMANNAKEMVEQAYLFNEWDNNIVVKIPVISEGLIAIKELTKNNITTLGTSVYGSVQGFYAALAGAKYIAPYVNRIDSQSGDGIAVVSELQILLEKHCPTSMVLAASFKTARQILDVMLLGCKAITLPVDLAEIFLLDPAIDAAIKKFEENWQDAFNSLTLE